jgi:hypothetical protein
VFTRSFSTTVRVELDVPATDLPEAGHLGEGHGLLTQEHDLLIDLQPRQPSLLKKDVAGLVLFRGVEDVVNGQGHA